MPGNGVMQASDKRLFKKECLNAPIAVQSCLMGSPAFGQGGRWPVGLCEFGLLSSPRMNS